MKTFMIITLSILTVSFICCKFYNKNEKVFEQETIQKGSIPKLMDGRKQIPSFTFEILLDQKYICDVTRDITLYFKNESAKSMYNITLSFEPNTFFEMPRLSYGYE